MARDLRKLIPLGSIVAEREFSFQRAGEPARTIRVQVGAPIPDPKYPSSALCPAVITGFDQEEKLVLGGIDTLQALNFALLAVASFLRSSARQHAGTLTWLGSADLGLPDPSSAPTTHQSP